MDYKIPKIIHQIWLGPNKRPDIWMNSWKITYCNNYPEWDYKLWTEKEINELNLINKKQYENEKFYNGKSDIARYEILNRFGGIFIDADSLYLNNNSNEKSNNLDWIIEKANINGGFFAATEPVNKQIYANGVIGSKINHPILSDMISHISSTYFNLKKIHSRERDIWTVTGTKPFTDVVNIHNDKLFKLDHIYFYPVSFHENNINLSVNKVIELYPNAIMLQYGYTTNNILRNNCMKKYINNQKS